jgi:hypothetical protein
MKFGAVGLPRGLRVDRRAAAHGTIAEPGPYITDVYAENALGRPA